MAAIAAMDVDDGDGDAVAPARAMERCRARGSVSNHANCRWCRVSFKRCVLESFEHAWLRTGS
eukprot:2143007-Pyramimonas_sp.AAC.1